MPQLHTARQDAVRLAEILGQQYEDELKNRGIESCVLAFRALSKSNIDFAAQAFNEIRIRGDCAAVALDVTGFFDNLDHKVLKNSWSALLGPEKLPSDHYAVTAILHLP